MELKEYRKRISLNASGAGYSPPQSATQSRGSYSSGSNGGDFSFAFPKFGDLPGSFLNNGSMAKTTSPTQNGTKTTTKNGQRSASSSNVNVPAMPAQESSNSHTAVSPTGLNGTKSISPTSTQTFQPPTNGFSNNDLGDLSNLFSPSILENASRSNSTDYISFSGNNGQSSSGSVRGNSLNSNLGQGQMSHFRQGSNASMTNSPASTMSHALESSCGTTPEASAESPKNRQGSESLLNTINEDSATQSSQGGKLSLLATDVKPIASPRSSNCRTLNR